MIKFTHFINITYTPGTLHEKLSKDHIPYILIQVKNWSIDIEELPHMPFLSLYLQLGATKVFIDVPTELFKSPQTRQIKIRIDDNYNVSNAENIAFREHFQKTLALFGLSSNICGCLKQFPPIPVTTSPSDLTSSFKQLLTAWVDPTLGESTQMIKQRIKLD
nr:1483_t:CDS:2 [Entrophospora candida]